MPSKEQTLSNDKASPKQRPPKSGTKNLDILAQPQSHLTTIIQQAGLDSSSLSPRDVLQLQRAVGNQAVGRLLAQMAHHQPPQEKENITGLPNERDNQQASVSAMRGKPSFNIVQRQFNIQQWKDLPPDILVGIARYLTFSDKLNLSKAFKDHYADANEEMPRKIERFCWYLVRQFNIQDWASLSKKDFLYAIENLTFSEKMNLRKAFNDHYGDKKMPPLIKAFCNKADRLMGGAENELDIFMYKHKYVTKYNLEPHKLFGNPSFTLYPLEKSEEERNKQSLRKVAHRPILDIEVVEGKFYARCYLGLYSKAKEKHHKDITADDQGNIKFQEIGLMNLGNPFKALLWCEDYLKNAEHHNTSNKPNPVIRSFLVPLEDADWMLDNTNMEARPLDQDRGAGQFGHPGAKAFYEEKMKPLVGSLVSFFLDIKEFQDEPKSNERKLPMPLLQKFLTGQWGEPSDMAQGIAAQHNRKGHKAEFNNEYQDSLTAYYESVSEENTGFTDATQGTEPAKKGKYAKQRFEQILNIDLSQFPHIEAEAQKKK